MAFHIVWGLFLWLSISKYGLGISTDSVHLLFGSWNLAEGKGLFSFDGGFLGLWPPLYPMLLAFVHILSGLNTFVSADILQVVSLLGVSFCLSLMFMKIFPEDFLLALVGNLLSDIGVVVLMAFGVVGSDYVHFLLVVIFFLLAGYYIERQMPFLLLAMSAVGMLAMLQRYLGIAVIATGVIVVLFFSGPGMKRRLSHSFLMVLSMLPAGTWLFITSPFIDRRAPISFIDNFTWFSRSILEWFFPTNALQPHLILYIVVLWVLVIGMILVLFLFRERRPSSVFVIPVFVYGLNYLLALFGSASISYFNKLGGRFLLPLYLPFIVLLVSTWRVLFQRVGTIGLSFLCRAASIGLIAGLALSAAGLLQITVPVVLQSYSDGAAGENAFNTAAWHSNTVIGYWMENPPGGDYLLFSNYPDAISFFTWHACFNSPAQYSGPYGKEEIPLRQYLPQLFVPGLPVYMIWIEPNEYSYYYNVEDLSSIAEIEPLFVSQDGGVYRLTPRVVSHALGF